MFKYSDLNRSFTKSFKTNNNEIGTDKSTLEYLSRKPGLKYYLNKSPIVTKQQRKINNLSFSFSKPPTIPTNNNKAPINHASNNININIQKPFQLLEIKYKKGDGKIILSDLPYIK